MELRFREIRPDEVEQELTQKDQFNTDAVPLAATLIRESIQNSTDARIGGPGEPATIKFSFTPPNPANGEYWRRILGQLEPHLNAAEIDYRHLELDRPNFLIIEDFGTSGLTGSFDKRENDNFNDFWRRVGRSHKGSTKGGSWGLGKLVFPVSSDIRSFFGLTIRHDDQKRALLMGQAILEGHRIGATDFSAHGFFAIHDRNGFQRPVLEPAEIARFSTAVGFHRVTEPGLSVAIPFPREGLSRDTLIPIVIDNYFFPIISGDLVVDIDGETISAATFDKMAGRFRSGALGDGHLIGFIREIEAARKKDPDLELPGTWASKGLDKCISGDELVALREAYDKHRLISVRAPMTMRTKRDEAVSGHFDLFLRKPADDVPQSALKPLFIRGSITVPNEESNFRNRRAFAALIAAEPNVSRFLRDAENPAHTSWNGSGDKLNDRWRNARQRLHEIRHALPQLFQLLDQAIDRRDNDALKSLLFVADREWLRPVAGRDSTRTSGSVPHIASTPRLFEIARRNGGFTVRGGEGLEASSLPFVISVQAAYDLPVGNPLKKHSPYDFNFRLSNDIQITATGARWNAPEANRLLLTVINTNFSVEVVGFDENRDLVIAASKVDDEAPF